MVFVESERSIRDGRGVYDERDGLYCFVWYTQAMSLKSDSLSSTKNPAESLNLPSFLLWPTLVQ